MSEEKPYGKLAAKIGAGAAAIVIGFVAGREGYRPTVYSDPIGRNAVCWGHDDPNLKLGTTYTREQCVKMLSDDLAAHADALDCIKVETSDGQKAAFVSFAFNVGKPAFCGSRLVVKANAGDMAGACAELSRWTLAGGRELPGLVKRRAMERALCES